MSTLESDNYHRQKRAILLICCLAPWVLGMSLSGVAISLPLIQNDLGADRADGQWIIGGYTIVLGCLVLMSGALAGRFGSRLVFSGGLAAFGLSSLGCAIAPAASALVAARLVQGVCSMTIVPLALLVVVETFVDRKKQAKALALWAAMASVSSVVNPLFAGWLASVTVWRILFVLLAMLGAAGCIAGLWLLPRKTGEAKQQLAIPRQLLLAATLVAGLATLIGGRTGLDVTYVTVGGCSFVLLLGLFVWLERRSSRRVIPQELWRLPGFRRGLAVQFGLFLAFNGFFFGNALYQQHVRGLSPFETMVWFLPGSLAVLLLSMLAHRVVGEGREHQLVALGLGAIGLGLLMLVLYSDTPIMLGSYVLIGAGLGLASGVIHAVNMAGMPSELSPNASALVAAATNIGNATGATLAVSTLAIVSQLWLRAHADWQLLRPEVKRAASGGAELTDGTRLEKQLVVDAFTHGLHIAYMVVAVLVFVAGALALTLSVPRLRQIR